MQVQETAFVFALRAKVEMAVDNISLTGISSDKT